MNDRLRELLFPLTICVIVGSIYSLAMAKAGEAKVERSVHPHREAAAAAAGLTAPVPMADIDTRELLD